MAATIREVARAAQVSIGTVSRALRNEPGMSEKTRSHVISVAAKIGYDNKNLRQKDIRRVTFLLHRQHSNFVSSPFFSHVLHSAEEACRDEGIALSVLSIGPADDIVGQLRRHAADGLVVAGFMEPEVLDMLNRLNKPLALIDLEAPGIRSINPDNRSGALLAMEHLIALGHRRIAFVSGSLAHYSIAQRALGYRQAFYNAGLLYDPNLEVTIVPGNDLDLAAEKVMRKLLAQGEPPDAVFVYNDVTALAIARYCARMGLRVPDDISVVGFDDIPAAMLASPALTTVAIDKEALGRNGMSLLLDQGAADATLTIPVQLIQRDSSASRRRGP